MITIDGSLGEGGGQVLRTSLALSAITGEPVALHNIRAGRRKPGLLRQHLAATRALAQICGANIAGAELSSDQLRFEPGPIASGAWEFAVGSAGSANLVAQTLLPALAMADGPSLITIKGGTHNGFSPTTDFLRTTFAPALARFGPSVGVNLKRHGFYPAGGGEMTLEVTPAPWRPATLGERGTVAQLRVRALSSQLSGKIGSSMVGRVGSTLELPREHWQVQRVSSPGPGIALQLEADTDLGTMLWTTFGDRRKRSEQVADELLAQHATWAASEAFVDEHLADQLLLPMALAGGSSILTTAPSLHTRTNIEVIERFLPVRFEISEAPAGWTVSVVREANGR